MNTIVIAPPMTSPRTVSSVRWWAPGSASGSAGGRIGVISCLRDAVRTSGPQRAGCESVGRARGSHGSPGFRTGVAIETPGRRDTGRREMRGSAAMRFVPTRIHGFVDYAMGAVLIAASLLTGGGAHTLASWLPVILGAGLIAYSLATDYELGMIRLIPMRTHLVLDAAGGVGV